LIEKNRYKVDPVRLLERINTHTGVIARALVATSPARTCHIKPSDSRGSEIEIEGGGITHLPISQAHHIGP